MIVRQILNGGVAEVDDEFGAELIAGGGWVVHGEAAPARKPRARKTAPVEETQVEE